MVRRGGAEFEHFPEPPPGTTVRAADLVIANQQLGSQLGSKYGPQAEAWVAI